MRQILCKKKSVLIFIEYTCDPIITGVEFYEKKSELWGERMNLETKDYIYRVRR